jgi:tape measure domain-containing protein
MVEEVSSSTREFVKLEERIEKLEDSLKRSAASVGNMNQNLAQSAQASDLAGIKLTALGYSLSQIGSTLRGLGGGLGSEMLGAAKDFEKTSISLRALVGDTEKADKLLRDMTTFAAKTPFEMPTLLGATKMLMQYGTKTEEILPILKSIGDVTGGIDAQKVMQMSYAFGQMSSTGRLMGQDLLQMINAGFNPLSEIAKKTGKSVAELKKEMESGRITVTMVKDAFASASGKLDLMNKQSRSLEGLQSTLNDNVGIFKRKLGEELVPTMKAFVDWQGQMTSSFDGLGASSKTAIAYTAGAVEVLGIGTEKLSSVAMTLAALKLSGMGAMMLSIVPSTIAAGKATVVWLDSLHSVVGTTQLMTGKAIAASVAWRVGIYGGIAAVTVGILEALSAQDKLNAAFEQAGRLSAKANKYQTGKHEAGMVLPAGATEIQKQEIYKSEAERLDTLIKGRQAALGKKSATLAKMEQSFEEVWFWREKRIIPFKEEIKVDQSELDYLQGLATEVQKLLNPAKDSTAAGAEVLKSLKLRDEAIGKSATETKILEYANKGLSKSELDLAKQREPQILAKEMIHKLEEETAQYEMSERELEKYKLAMSGLPPLLREAVQSHMDLRDAAKKEAEARSLAEKQTAETEAAVRKMIETHTEETEIIKAGSKEQWLLNKAMAEGLEISQAAALVQAEADNKAAKLQDTIQKATEAFKEEARTESYFMKDRIAAIEKLSIAERGLLKTRSLANQGKVDAARKALEELDKANVKNYNLAKQAEAANLPGAKEFAAQAKLSEARDREQKGREESLKLAEKLLTPEQRFAKAQEFAREMLEKNIYTYEQYKKAIAEARSEKNKFDASGIAATAFGGAESMWRIAEFEAGRGRTAAIARGAKKPSTLAEFLAQPGIGAKLAPQAARAKWQWAQAKSLRDNNPNFQAMTPVGDAGGNDVDETTLVLKEIRDLNKKMLDKDPLEGVELSNASSGGGL